MPVYYTTDFEGKWPVGTAAVVSARDEVMAREMLTKEMAKAGLTSPQSFTLMKLKQREAVILADGNY